VVSVLINYVSIIVDIVASNVVMTINVIVTIPNSNWVNESENGSDTATKSGGVNLFINGQGPLLAFNSIVEFLKKLQRNEQGVQTKNYGACQDF
jgi:hypothetical protein